MKMGLKHAHVTMVNRDDLPDGGASVMAATVRAIRARAPGCSVEVLTSDFMGSREAIAAVVESAPDIVSHNVETVRRLTPRVRSRSTLRAVTRVPADRARAGPRRGGEVQHHARPRRDTRRGAGDPGRSSRGRRGHREHRPVPAAHAHEHPGAEVLDTRRSSPSSGRRRWRRDSSTARPVPWSAPPTTPVSSTRASGRTSSASALRAAAVGNTATPGAARPRRRSAAAEGIRGDRVTTAHPARGGGGRSRGPRLTASWSRRDLSAQRVRPALHAGRPRLPPRPVDQRRPGGRQGAAGVQHLLLPGG